MRAIPDEDGRRPSPRVNRPAQPAHRTPPADDHALLPDAEGAATTVYLGLGSNLGDRAASIAAAVHALSERRILRHMCVSRVYETEPVAVDAQPLYLNAVVRGQTLLSAAALLGDCLTIESGLGRVRPPGQPKAPRVIDIDLLLYGAEIVETPRLTVPHPALLARAFVLIPLAEVAEPGLRHPITGETLTRAAPCATVRVLVPP